MPTEAEVKQAIFDGGRDAAVAEAARMMRKKKWGGLGDRRTLKEVLTFLAKKRKKVAEKQRDPAAAEFGAVRQEHALEAQVLGGVQDTRQKMASYGYVSSKTEITARYPAEAAEVARTMANPGRLRSASIVRGPDTDTGQPGDVIGYHMKTPTGTKVTATASAGFLNENPIWAHTPVSLVGVVLGEAEVWHSQLITGHDSIKVHALGMVTWHVCNAMPYKRGSAAVMEWFNLAADRAFDLGLGQRGGYLDLPAFRIDANRYANNYAEIYAGRYVVT